MSSSELNSQLLERRFLTGGSFTIGTVILRPYASYTNVSLDGRIVDIDGYVHQIVLYLAFKYQFTFEYIPSLDSALGAFVNGSWNGLVGMLYRGEIDFIAAALTMTYARTTVIGFTFPFDDDDRALLIPYPELEILGNIDGIIRPFQYEIWISIGITVLAIATVLWKILSLEFSMINYEEVTTIKIKKISFIQSLKSLLRFQYILQPRSPACFLLVAWCLLIVVLVNSYSSTVTSYLMTPRYRAMIESVDDIVNMTRPVFMVSKFSSHESDVLGADSGTLLKIGDSLRKYPELSRKSNIAYGLETAELIAKQRKVLGAGKAALLTLIEQDLKTTGQCRLNLAKKPWGVYRPSFGLPKSSPLIEEFNHEIIWLRQFGLLDFWHRRYWPRPNRCTEPLTININHNTSQKLILKNLSSAFFLLGCGCIASSVVFVCELIFARAKRSSQQ